MKKLITLFFVLGLMLIFPAFSSSAQTVGTAYYVDAENGDDNNDGTGEDSAWKTLDKVNSTTFEPGDRILLKRGQTFEGMCWPKGSGSNGAPIILGSYGTGNRPVIDGGENEAAVKLLNQEYWEIRDVETTGGDPRGIAVKNETNRTLNYFRITNCEVHDVKGKAYEKPAEDGDGAKKQGLIVFWSDYGTVGAHFNDVVVDSCTAHSTERWAGIMVYSNPSNDDFGASTNVTVKNCTVYDTGGDGIAVFSGSSWIILENNVAYDIGKTDVTVLGTPNGIWTWRAKDAVIRYNEVYKAHSPLADGGAYDIDYTSTNTWVEYNYAHDCDAYGVAVFGADDASSQNSVFTNTTKNATVRYNVLSNNGREPGKYGAQQGDFYIYNWGGNFDEIKVYNNTSYWNPVEDAPAVYVPRATFTGSGLNVFKNNLIYSTVPTIVSVAENPPIEFDHNLYWYSGSGDPVFKYNGSTYYSFEDYQNGTGQDADSIYADPKVKDITYHETGFPTAQFSLLESSPAIDAGVSVEGEVNDFLGNPVYSNAVDIGAYEWQGEKEKTIDVTVSVADPEGNAVNGAVFTVGRTAGETVEYLGCDGEWTEELESAAEFVSENGSFTVTGLPAGEYFLQQLTAPEGYMIPEEPVSFTAGEEDEAMSVAVVNQPEKEEGEDEGNDDGQDPIPTPPSGEDTDDPTVTEPGDDQNAAGPSDKEKIDAAPEKPDNRSPRTGDEGKNLTGYTVAMILAVCCAGILAVSRRKEAGQK